TALLAVLPAHLGPGAAVVRRGAARPHPRLPAAAPPPRHPRGRPLPPPSPGAGPPARAAGGGRLRRRTHPGHPRVAGTRPGPVLAVRGTAQSGLPAAVRRTVHGRRPGLPPRLVPADPARRGLGRVRGRRRRARRLPHGAAAAGGGRGPPGDVVGPRRRRLGEHLRRRHGPGPAGALPRTVRPPGPPGPLPLRPRLRGVRPAPAGPGRPGTRVQRLGGPRRREVRGRGGARDPAVLAARRPGPDPAVRRTGALAPTPPRPGPPRARGVGPCPVRLAWGFRDTTEKRGPFAVMAHTHEVFNQPSPLADHDVSADPALLEGLEREGGGWAVEEVRELGRLAGSARARSWAEQADTHPPVLRTHDRYGHGIDEVDFHPAGHVLMDTAVTHGLHAAPWADDRAGAHVARAAKFFVWSQAEAGHGCPISMTYAAVPALRHSPDLAARFEPLLTARVYDFGLRPPHTKRGLLAGMSMTEKQGGSDVRANTTRAVAAPDGTYRLRGHKWFTSAPMNDLFLTLAQTAEGLTCFLVPRVLEDGSRNALTLQRLKDKLGNRSNAS